MKPPKKVWITKYKSRIIPPDVEDLGEYARCQERWHKWIDEAPIEDSITKFYSPFNKKELAKDIREMLQRR